MTEDAQAAGSGTFQSSVPWNQIPKFTPGETDMKVYSKKLQFLKAMWPEEHIAALAPRAALMVEGVAFQKVSKLDPAKLKSEQGVKYLVEALGGQWGRLPSEETYELFEKALYATVLRSDEWNDSYLARHDASFEDLVSSGVKIEEIRAYVLLRQSMLSMEDRKKVVLECKGKLDYTQACQSIRLLGSRFFQKLQSSGKAAAKTKTYDVHQVEEDMIYHMDEVDLDEDAFVQQLIEAGDEDACFINDFEEQVLAACQESSELSSCFTTYQEARQRLHDKATSRGFWPLGKAKGGKGGKKGRFGGGGKGGPGSFGKRRSLADRIANSICRRCLQPGHWKRECPNPPANAAGSKKPGESEST